MSGPKNLISSQGNDIHFKNNKVKQSKPLLEQNMYVLKLKFPIRLLKFTLKANKI